MSSAAPIRAAVNRHSFVKSQHQSLQKGHSNMRHMKLSSSLALIAAICTLGGAPQVHAALVPLDIAAMGMAGVNAGLAVGGGKLAYPSTGAAFFLLTNQQPIQPQTNYNLVTGIRGGGVQFVVTSLDACSPARLGGGSTITSDSMWATGNASAFRLDSLAAPAWGGGSYMGFRYSTNWGYRYGWLEVTWDGVNFEVLSGVHESSFNTPVTIPIPAPGAVALFGAVGLVGSRRRR